MTPSTREISRDQWRPYLDQLGKDHQGWFATVEVIGRDIGDQPIFDGLPFMGMSFEKQGSEAGDILIEMGDEAHGFETHHVNHPNAVRVADTRAGEEEDVEIECSDGSKTLLRLRRAPALPA